jgi:hypothetical protein
MGNERHQGDHFLYHMSNSFEISSSFQSISQLSFRVGLLHRLNSSTTICPRMPRVRFGFHCLSTAETPLECRESLHEPNNHRLSQLAFVKNKRQWLLRKPSSILSSDGTSRFQPSTMTVNSLTDHIPPNSSKTNCQEITDLSNRFDEPFTPREIPAVESLMKSVPFVCGSKCFKNSNTSWTIVIG